MWKLTHKADRITLIYQKPLLLERLASIVQRHEDYKNDEKG